MLTVLNSSHDPFYNQAFESMCSSISARVRYSCCGRTTPP